ncbi:hypothetical protein [Streptomyces sp. bgisy060]|uniref:hypothetical protein n=1 Tax=Streptomyces sp. bgisy060 TaxID=3413775 RepID=UPI003EBCA55C
MSQCPACETEDWAMCAGCGLCQCERHDDCTRPAGRCPAAHPADPTPCDGPANVLLILDQTNAGTYGCTAHGSRLLASLTGARPVSGPEHPGAAIVAHKAAQGLPSFLPTGPAETLADLLGTLH